MPGEPASSKITFRYNDPHHLPSPQPASNQRWCSDIFLIPCWSGEVLSVAFAIDCHESGSLRVDGVAPAAERGRHSHAYGQGAMGALR